MAETKTRASSPKKTEEAPEVTPAVEAAESKSVRARVGTEPEARTSEIPGVKAHILREDIAKSNESREEGSVVSSPDNRLDDVDGAGSGTRQNDEAAARKDSGAVQDDLKKWEADLKKFGKDLENKSEAELRQLYQDALWAESEVKRELYILRQRVGSLSSNAETDLEDRIAELRVEGQEALMRLKALEQKLFGQTKDVWGTSY